MATCPTCRAHYPDEVKTCAADGSGLLPDEAFRSVEPDLAPGHPVGEYRVEHKLGEGGFGSVYRAVHPLIGKTVAIKVLNRQYSSSPQMVSRFIAEARAVNQIRHRNIIDIFSFGSLDDGRQYYVMELLEGMPCDAYIASKGRLSPEEALPILRGVARALDAAHAAGIAHRDLKPENIYLVFDEDGGVFPKLLDFGIAKLLGDSSMTGHKTRTGTPLGTPYYMSPEQCRGKNIDHRTDIYSFGILTHAMLTGQVPFDGDDVMDILVKQTAVPPPRMSSVRPDLPAALDQPVLRMLAKDPGERPPSLMAAVDELAKVAKDAGYAVQLSSGRSSGDPRPGIAGGSTPGAGKMTPADSAFSEAKTLVAPDSSGARTMLAAEALPSAPPVRRSTAIAVVAAFALLGLGAGVLLALRSDGEGAAAVQPIAPASALAAPMAAPVTTAATQVEPARTAEVVPAAPADDIELTIQSTPAAADVLLDSKKIGTTAAPIRLKRGDAKVKLTIKAPGYKDHEIQVLPSSNSTMKVQLTKVPSGSAPAKKISPDLEQPF